MAHGVPVSEGGSPPDDISWCLNRQHGGNLCTRIAPKGNHFEAPTRLGASKPLVTCADSDHFGQILFRAPSARTRKLGAPPSTAVPRKDDLLSITNSISGNDSVPPPSAQPPTITALPSDTAAFRGRRRYGAGTLGRQVACASGMRRTRVLIL